MSEENLNNAKKLFLKGVEAYKIHKYRDAEEKLLESDKILPGRLSTIFNIIAIYVTIKDKVKLKKFINNYKYLDKNKEIRYGLAFLHYFENDHKTSIDLCKSLLHFEDIKNSMMDLLALNYKDLKEYKQALNIYRQRLKKKNFITFYNIGSFFFSLGKVNQALFYFKKSQKLKKDNYSNLWNLALCYLKTKKLRLGFDLYENRWKKDNPVKLKVLSKQQNLILSDLVNKKILIFDEQGLGDTIQFSRFVIDMLKYTDQITFCVEKKLKKILFNINKKISVITYNELNYDYYDFHIPVCSLPKLLKLKTLDDINFYKLNINENDNLIKLDGNKINIGIAWQGNYKFTNDRFRSIPSNYVFNFIEKNNKINFYKLSQDSKNEEYNIKNLNSNLINLDNKSLYEISKIIKKLDLVISCDTSIVHLAGIQDIKCILLLSYNSDWRWFDNLNSTEWYPSLKIIKQNKLGDWKNVFSKLELEMNKLYNEKYF